MRIASGRGRWRQGEAKYGKSVSPAQPILLLSTACLRIEQKIGIVSQNASLQMCNSWRYVDDVAPLPTWLPSPAAAPEPPWTRTAVAWCA
jgi:hypothetical protein